MHKQYRLARAYGPIEALKITSDFSEIAGDLFSISKEIDEFKKDRFKPMTDKLIAGMQRINEIILNYQVLIKIRQEEDKR